MVHSRWAFGMRLKTKMTKAGISFPADHHETDDEVRELAVVWVAAGLSSQQRDAVVGGAFPVRVQVVRAGV